VHEEEAAVRAMLSWTAVPMGRHDGMIHVEGLRFTYPGNREETLRGLCFHVAPGEIFGLLGPSGAGKSTTQKILIGLLRGFSGSVKVRGRNLTDYGTEYYESIGVSFELPSHFTKLTARENLRLFRSLYRGATRDPMELLDLVGLADEADQRVGSYSKGMKMRLNFVRALLPDPEIVFLDEPTVGMDPVNACRIKDQILELKRRGKTVFLTTHNMNDADELCDRVAFIVEGELRLIDAPRTLKIRHGRRQVVIEHRVGGQLAQQRFGMDGLGDNTEFLRLLKEHAIETIHSQEATLEDIFVETTGRRLQ
jgi:fluoroquinolone transport system ATP-binding protein